MDKTMAREKVRDYEELPGVDENSLQHVGGLIAVVVLVIMLMDLIVAFVH